MISFFRYRLKPLHIWLAAILSIAMLAVMDIYSLPAIAKEAGGIPAFDLQTFGYTPQTATAFLQALSESGKRLFLRFQLPLDFAFAFVYTFLFLALMIRLNKRGAQLIAFPILLFLFDITENIFSIVFLTRSEIPQVLFQIGSAVTLTKNALTAICALIIIVFLILLLKNRKKKK